MLTDIYARSMLTATRNDIVCVRDLPPVTGPLLSTPSTQRSQNVPSGVFTNLARLIKRLITPRRRVHCINLQEL